MSYKTAKEAEEEFMNIGKQMLHEIWKFCVKREKNGYSNGETLKDSDKVTLAEAVIFSHSPFELMEHHERRVIPNKPQIDAREETFFIDNRDLYPDVPEKHVTFLTKLWTDQQWGFNERNKSFYWKCMDVMNETVADWIKFPEIAEKLVEFRAKLNK